MGDPPRKTGHESRRQLVVLGEAVEKIAILKTAHLDHGVYELPRAVEGKSAVSLTRDPANCHVKLRSSALIECERQIIEESEQRGYDATSAKILFESLLVSLSLYVQARDRLRDILTEQAA